MTNNESDLPDDFQMRLDDYQPAGWFAVNNVDEMEAFYRSRLPAIKEAAKTLGYAIAVHGSMRRDFDLIATPWIGTPADRNELALAIQKAACGLTQTAYSWEQKPHGRMAASFPICWCEWHDMVSAGHVDLSVVSALSQMTPQGDTRKNTQPQSCDAFRQENGKHADIVERLRGKVVIPITDGLGPVDGQKDFFERTFPTSNLAMEAADYIEKLRQSISQPAQTDDALNNRKILNTSDDYVNGLHSKIDMDIEDQIGREITLEESKLIGLAIKSVLKALDSGGK